MNRWLKNKRAKAVAVVLAASMVVPNVAFAAEPQVAVETNAEIQDRAASIGDIAGFLTRAGIEGAAEKYKVSADNFLKIIAEYAGFSNAFPSEQEAVNKKLAEYAESLDTTAKTFEQFYQEAVEKKKEADLFVTTYVNPIITVDHTISNTKMIVMDDVNADKCRTAIRAYDAADMAMDGQELSDYVGAILGEENHDYQIYGDSITTLSGLIMAFDTAAQNQKDFIGSIQYFVETYLGANAPESITYEGDITLSKKYDEINTVYARQIIGGEADWAALLPDQKVRINEWLVEWSGKDNMTYEKLVSEAKVISGQYSKIENFVDEYLTVHKENAADTYNTTADRTNSAQIASGETAWKALSADEKKAVNDLTNATAKTTNFDYAVQLAAAKEWNDAIGFATTYLAYDAGTGEITKIASIFNYQAILNGETAFTAKSAEVKNKVNKLMAEYVAVTGETDYPALLAVAKEYKTAKAFVDENMTDANGFVYSKTVPSNVDAIRKAIGEYDKTTSPTVKVKIDEFLNKATGSAEGIDFYRNDIDNIEFSKYLVDGNGKLYKEATAANAQQIVDGYENWINLVDKANFNEYLTAGWNELYNNVNPPAPITKTYQEFYAAAKKILNESTVTDNEAAKYFGDQYYKELTLENAPTIIKGEADYNALTDAQKAIVAAKYGDYPALLANAKQMVADKTASDAFVASVPKEATLENAKQIVDLKAAYDALTPEAKAYAKAAGCDFEALYAKAQKLLAEAEADEKIKAEVKKFTDTYMKDVTYVTSANAGMLVSGEGDYAKLSAEAKAIVDKLNYTAKLASAKQINAVTYQAHVQNEGWMNNVKTPAAAGTTGRGLDLQALVVNGGTDIQYTSRGVGDADYQPWRNNSNISGTVGQSKALEAFKITLTGDMSEKYDVYYRVHASDFGWMGWASNGQEAGTGDYNGTKNAQAIEIYLAEKGAAAPGSADNAYSRKPEVQAPALTYETQVQTYGWMDAVNAGDVAGTVGQGLRMETIKLNLSNMSGIQYRTHVQNYGWEQEWASNGQEAGTVGQSLRLEAIEIKLTDEMAEKYDVYYQVHAQDFGWLGLAKNGESAGTAGYSYRLEGIRVMLVEKGQPAPAAIEGTSGSAFVER